MDKIKKSWRKEIQFWFNNSPGEISEIKLTTIQESYKINFVTINSDRLIWYWDENKYRPFNVSSIDQIRGIVSLVGIVNDANNLLGFLFVKKRNHSKISLPEATLTFKQFNQTNHSYNLLLYKTIRNHFGISSEFIWHIDLQNKIHKIAKWQYHIDYCLRSYTGLARMFYLTINEKYLPKILAYRNQTIEEVLFVRKSWLESCQIEIVNGKLMSQTIWLTNGSDNQIAPLHLILALKLCQRPMVELIRYLPIDEIRFD